MKWIRCPGAGDATRGGRRDRKDERVVLSSIGMVVVDEAGNDIKLAAGIGTLDEHGIAVRPAEDGPALTLVCNLGAADEVEDLERRPPLAIRADLRSDKSSTRREVCKPTGAIGDLGFGEGVEHLVAALEDMQLVAPAVGDDDLVRALRRRQVLDDDVASAGPHLESLALWDRERALAARGLGYDGPFQLESAGAVRLDLEGAIARRARHVQRHDRPGSALAVGDIMGSARRSREGDEAGTPRALVEVCLVEEADGAVEAHLLRHRQHQIERAFLGLRGPTRPCDGNRIAGAHALRRLDGDLHVGRDLSQGCGLRGAARSRHLRQRGPWSGGAQDRNDGYGNRLAAAHGQSPIVLSGHRRAFRPSCRTSEATSPARSRP